MTEYYRPPYKYSKLREKILDLLELYGKDVYGSVLHVGSGEDNFRYRQYFPNAKQYRCLDIQEFPNVNIVADAQNMPEVPSNSESCVIAVFFLLKVPDIKAALGEIKRITKPGGTVFFTFLNKRWKRFGINKMNVKQALELLDGFFKDRRVYRSDIGIAVVAYKPRETALWSGIEIAKDKNPPHLQAKFEMRDDDTTESQRIGKNSTAIYKQRKSEDGGTTFTYSLIYDEINAFQVKTWIKMNFREQIEIHFRDGSTETIRCKHDVWKKGFDSIKFGTHWDRMKILTIDENPPVKFMLGGCSLELLNIDRVSHIICYRKRNLSVIEFAFIWKRFLIPKSAYKLAIKLTEDEK